jgi:hypothetical protein
MIDRTLYRPREIIQFCTLALECARDSHATVPLHHAAVREAEYPHSRERARDIAAEYRFQYPGLLSILEAFRGKDSIFSRDDIELLCLELITRELPTRGTDGWLDECTPESLVEILWNVGLLRAETRQDTRHRQVRAASFLGPHQASQQTVAAAQRFQIHPMFWAYLGSQSPAASRARVPSDP